MAETASLQSACPHCGSLHQTTCPRISAIEYHNDGTVKRVEFHAPQPFNINTVLCGESPAIARTFGVPRP